MRDVLSPPRITRMNDLVSEAQEALRKGLVHDAYALSLQATQVQPENGEAWLLRAGLAASLEEKVLCVNRMNELGVRQDDRHHLAFFALKEVLERDPFLAYAEETQELYRVRNAERTMLSIAKKRSITPAYPAEGKIDSLALSHRLLIFAILGLLLAGLGTLIFAPLAAWSALAGDRSELNRSARIDSLVVSIAALGLFIIGAFFSILFIMHWIG
jgi:hypothetical protein